MVMIETFLDDNDVCLSLKPIQSVVVRARRPITGENLNISSFIICTSSIFPIHLIPLYPSPLDSFEHLSLYIQKAEGPHTHVNLNRNKWTQAEGPHKHLLALIKVPQKWLKWKQVDTGRRPPEAFKPSYKKCPQSGCKLMQVDAGGCSYQWSSVVISGYQLLLVFISGYQWLSVGINGYQWLSVGISGYQWLKWLNICKRL